MRKIIIVVCVLLTLIPCVAFAEETFTFTESELHDFIVEAVMNDPESFGFRTLSEYEDLEREYALMQERLDRMPDPDEQEENRTKNILILLACAAAIIFGYYKLYESGQRKAQEAYDRGYAAAKSIYKNDDV